MQSYPVRRRRRWPIVLVVVLALIGGLWTASWHYAAGRVEATIAGWKEREARVGRHYTCTSQTIAGFPFGIHVRCTEAGAELTSVVPPLSLKARDVLVSAQIWQPTVLTTQFAGPVVVREREGRSTITADWRAAQSRVHGTPAAPERVEILAEESVVDRSDDGGTARVFQAARLVIDGRIVGGSVRDNPVIEVTLNLMGGIAPTLHPAAAAPIDADIAAVLRGLRDFAPKPWPQRFRELQAAGGRIEITHARLQQGEAIAVAQGALGISPNGRLDGQLQLTVANLEKLLPALGLDKNMPPQAAPPKVSAAFDRLDRLAPGLGAIARQNAAPALVAGLAFLGRPTELEGKRAYMLPLRFSDGAASLGPIPLGQTPPLF